MFSKIFIEEELLLNNDYKNQIDNILSRHSSTPTETIRRYDDIFGKVKKPYLQKRDSLQLFIAAKRGNKVKIAPDAYGLSGEPHYYFIHFLNCPYECQYCYLQAHFDSPDLVLFINIDEILSEIEEIIRQTNGPVWFHAGEFSDSLALSHLSGELPKLFSFFRKHPQAKLELRTKSANTRELLKENPCDNIITSFTLTPEKESKEIDLKAPPTATRIKAIQKLVEKSFPIGIHFDPIIWSPSFAEDYTRLINDLEKVVPLNSIEYYSMGVVRFPPQLYSAVEKNYADASFLHHPFVKSFDNKKRYSRPLRGHILRTVKSLLMEKGVDDHKIYLCME